jgi:hypothetical protein
LASQNPKLETTKENIRVALRCVALMRKHPGQQEVKHKDRMINEILPRATPTLKVHTSLSFSSSDYVAAAVIIEESILLSQHHRLRHYIDQRDKAKTTGISADTLSFVCGKW